MNALAVAAFVVIFSADGFAGVCCWVLLVAAFERVFKRQKKSRKLRKGARAPSDFSSRARVTRS